MESIIERHTGTFDHSQYPFISIKHKPLDPTIGDVDDFFDTQERIYDHYQGPFVVIVDASNVGLISVAARKQHVRRMKSLEQKYEGRLVAISLSIPSIAGRLMFRSVSFLQKHQVPQYVSKTVEEAQAIAERVLEQAISSRNAESAAS